MIVEPFKKAILTVADAITTRDENPANILYRDACIQRFEYTYELAVRFIYKALKTKLDTKYIESISFVHLMKEAAKASLIKEPLIWESFREARNRTSHAYEEKIAIEVSSIIKPFYEHAIFLLDALESGRYG